MKSVVIIDASPMFQEFLKDKLTDEKVSVTVAKGQRDAFVKILSVLPDLIIIDLVDDFSSFVEFLEKKYKDPNASKIPIIVSGPVIEKEKIAVLIKFGVVKYFTKPIKFDVFFEAVGKVLRLSFSMDITPCVLDIHRNGDLIFIEIAQNLNREKISLLKYKLAEMIETEKIENPKIVLMMTNLDLSFIDTTNLELLLDNIIDNPAIKKKNVKVLSLSDFAKDLIEGHLQYSEIESSESLPDILNSLVESNASSSISDLIAEKVLTPARIDDGSIETRFQSDLGATHEDSEGSIIRAAVVDDDAVTLKLLQNALSAIGAQCDEYSSGSEFMRGVKKYKYDLVILDIFMPGISGFDILKGLQAEKQMPPIVIYSQATQREYVMQALSMGAKQYIAKPQKPEYVVQKALELINAKS